jgi:hypothetical protein
MTDSAVPSSALSRPLPGVVTNPAVWVALLALATVWFHLSGPLGPDVSWLITVSERILQGQRLYIDILEPNPPVAGYLYMLPVMLAHAVGMKAEPFVVLYTVGYGVLMTGITAHIVREAGLLKRIELLWPVSFLLIGACWGEDFGQREHFATMSMLPLVAVTALRAGGMKPRTWQWILAGLCGGFILAIKPHFALALAVPALYAAIRVRSIRPVFAPENWIAAAIFAGFLALIWFAFPAFITNIMPVATTVYVPDRRDLGILFGLFVVRIFLALAAVGLLGYWKKIADTPFLGTLFMAAIGFFFAFLAQARGYTYQIMPSITLMTVFIVIAFAQGIEARARAIGNVLAIGCAVIVASIFVINDVYKWRMREPLYALLEPYGPGLRFANILPDLTAGSPLHRVLDGELINSPPALLMSMSAYRLREERVLDPEWSARIDAVENGERVQLREDMKARPPDIIVTSGSMFDWFQWAQEDPELAAMLTDFEDIGMVPFDGYTLRLLKRRGLEPTAH